LAWLAQMYRTDRRVLRPAGGWSQFWPLARSTASALTRLGDPEPMRRFIADQLRDEAGERANLNYWAFWTGDFDEQQTCDDFIGSTPLSAWHGDRMMRHLLDRLYGNIGFLELNIHTLWSLRASAVLAAELAQYPDMIVTGLRIPGVNGPGTLSH
jgi:hypothetical protein